VDSLDRCAQHAGCTATPSSSAVLLSSSSRPRQTPNTSRHGGRGVTRAAVPGRSRSCPWDRRGRGARRRFKAALARSLTCGATRKRDGGAVWSGPRDVRSSGRALDPSRARPDRCSRAVTLAHPAAGQRRLPRRAACRAPARPRAARPPEARNFLRDPTTRPATTCTTETSPQLQRPARRGEGSLRYLLGLGRLSGSKARRGADRRLRAGGRMATPRPHASCPLGSTHETHRREPRRGAA
jgi:hypothetical protein